MAAAATTLTLTAYEANALTFESENKADGVAVFSDIYYPGWTCTIDGEPADIVVPEKATLTCLTANAIQEVMRGEPIADIVFEMGGAASGATIAGLAEGLTYAIDGALITISGTPTESCTYVVTVTGGPREVTTTGIITCVTPYRVLTGDWYPFQDLESALPADLQGVLSTVTGDDAHPSRIDPAYKESDGNVPAGCTLGALVMGRNNGGARWDFTDGVLQLLVNLHITGGRTFKINYTLADGTQHTANVAKMSKGTYCAWDVLAQAGIDDEMMTDKEVGYVSEQIGRAHV